jgi:hypothetical protein
MYQVKNNRRLARQLLANICGRPAVIVDLRDATAFIAMHGDRTPAWLKAAVAVQRADRDARRVNQATQSLENAMRIDGMLEPVAQTEVKR